MLSKASFANHSRPPGSFHLIRDKPSVTREIGRQIEQWNREAAGQPARSAAP